MFKSKKNDRKYWLRRRYGQSRSRARIKRSTVKFEIFIELTFFKQKIKLINGSGVNVEIFNPKLYNKSVLRKTLGYDLEKRIYICVVFQEHMHNNIQHKLI